MEIHSTAIVHPKAELGEGVEVGAYCVIDEHVKVGAGTIIKNHVTVTGHTTIGENNQIWPGAVLGGAPQDLKYAGGPTKLIVGSNNVIRECVTMNTGTETGYGTTTIGNHGFFMACSHVAHDCAIRDHVILANCVLMGGHVEIESSAKLMGMAGVNPFATVGEHAFIGGLTRVVHDVPPYMIFEGNPGLVRQVNVVGLERAGLTKEDIDALREAHRVIFRPDVLNRRAVLDELEDQGDLTEHVQRLVAFLRRSYEGPHGRYRESLRGKV